MKYTRKTSIAAIGFPEQEAPVKTAFITPVDPVCTTAVGKTIRLPNTVS